MEGGEGETSEEGTAGDEGEAAGGQGGLRVVEAVGVRGGEEGQEDDRSSIEGKRSESLIECSTDRFSHWRTPDASCSLLSTNGETL